jgi:nucleoside-diphosphate-sugar epimerase
VPKQKKVLLLGGTGAMGVYLAPELTKLGFEVFVTSRSSRKHNNGVTFIQGDAKDVNFISSLLQDNTYDAIIDFMVYRTDEFRNRVHLLVEGTSHYIFLSSYRVFAGSEKPMNESSPRLLDVITDKEYLETDEYGLTKARQEDILKNCQANNWTIVRPAITYSKERFQLGTMESGEFLYRAINNKEVIFPKEMLQKITTMSWAGDVAKMIARITANKKSFGQIYIASTSESHTWEEVIDIYKKIIDIKITLVSLSDYINTIGRPYQIKYDRMYNRLIDNQKILKVTGLNKTDLISLEQGLRTELKKFLKAPKFNPKELNNDRNIDKILLPKKRRINVKSKLRSNLKKVKYIVKAKLDYDGAILSLGGYYNYGGIIQRYALQKFLRKKGYNFKIFKLDFMEKFGDVQGDKKNLENFAKKYFIEEKFRPTIGGFYKTYIVGSDQVWRDWFGGNWNKFGIFFLSFVKNKNAKRIAYSASFGREDLVGAGINARNRNKVRKLIKKFHYISVREKTAVELVGQLQGEASITLDPTLLLLRDDYSNLIDDNPNVKKVKIQPIFTYILDNSEPKNRFIENLKNQLNKTSSDLIPSDCKELPSIEFWLKGFRDSELVITDSFHGIVFAIINHKQFIAFGNKTRGLSRMLDLLETFGLEDKIINEDNIKDVKFNNLLAPINWDKIEKILNDKRKESSEWLINSIEGM